MSQTEEEIAVAPWIGPASCRKAISVIVLSSDIEIINKLSEALKQSHDKGNFSWKLLLVRSLTLEEIIKLTNVTGNIAIDFVIIALDTSKVFCLAWADRIIGQIHPDLRRRRTILVNPTGLPANGMAITANDLVSFSSKFKFDLLSASVFDNDESAVLGNRLIKYIEVTIGIENGLPNLNI